MADLEKKNVKIKTIAYAVIIFSAVYLVAVGVAIYFFGANNQLTKKTAAVVPYPAAIVNLRSLVLVNDLQNNLASVQRFYENQDFSETGFRVDFRTEDGQKRLKIKEKNLLNKMIEDKIIGILAKDRGIQITADMVSQEVKRKMDELGSKEDVVTRLQKLYGWTINDFENKIVYPEMLKNALWKQVSEKEIDFNQAKNKIAEVDASLKNKQDFAEVAKKYSEGVSAKDGGDLGWFSMDQLAPEISVVAAKLEKGERSEIIETPFGYNIVLVTDKKTENNVIKEKISQIFVATETFADWLSGQEKNFKISVPLKDFVWNSQSQQVEFKDQSLKEFEDNLYKNSSGDVSVMF